MKDKTVETLSQPIHDSLNVIYEAKLEGDIMRMNVEQWAYLERMVKRAYDKGFNNCLDETRRLENR